METPSAKDAMAFGKETLHLVKIDSLWQKGYCLRQKKTIHLAKMAQSLVKMTMLS